jgi:polysaccharide deacetylase 2 family uncharacterized protein YibQ
MDEKLRAFVDLLHPPSGGVPAAAAAGPAPPLAGLPPRRAPGAPPRRRLPSPPLRVRLAGSGKIWARLTGGIVVLAMAFAAVWFVLPASPPPAPAWPTVATIQTGPIRLPPPTPMPATTAPVTAPAAPAAQAPLPKPESAPEEAAEMTAPDPPVLPEPPPAPAPEPKLAALAPPPLPPVRRGEPAWLRFAVPAAPAHGHPRIAIVIDDLGLDKRRTEHAIALKGPLTLSFLAYATDLPRLAAEARRAGHELLVHVPMEPISRAEDMGPNGLAVGLGRDEVLRRLRWDLGRFDGYVGINNHMGSRFTGDARSMTPVMEELKARGLLFLDSRTIATSAGIELAQRYGVPTAGRDVFLDNEVTAAAVAQRLAEVEQIARRHGSAIAIGHPHDVTLEQLAGWLAGLPSKGFVLTPVSAIVKERWHAEGAKG